jgi:hypothetical protein
MVVPGDPMTVTTFPKVCKHTRTYEVYNDKLGKWVLGNEPCVRALGHEGDHKSILKFNKRTRIASEWFVLE